MNYHKLKEVIGMKFMGGGENGEIRKQLIEYVEKQEPKKVVKTIVGQSELGTVINVKCPNCDNEVTPIGSHCRQCGQKIFFYD